MIVKNSLILINIFFLVATIVTIATTYSQREKKAIKYLILYSAFYALLSFLVINVLLWEETSIKILFSRLRYISFSFLPFIWFLCVNEIFDYWNWVRRKFFIRIIILVCILSIVLSLLPSLSFLFCYDFKPVIVMGVRTLMFKNGPWFNVHMTLSICFYILSAWISLKVFFQSRSYQRLQSLILLLSMITCIIDPIIVYTKSELRWLMVSMVVFFINQLAILLCNYKFRLLDIFSISPYQLLKELPDPLIIFDEKGIAITKNKKATEYLEFKENDQTIKDLSKELSHGEIEKTNLINPYSLKEHYFNAYFSELTSNHQIKGHLLYLKDINEEHIFQQKLNKSLQETQTLLSLISHDVLGSISSLQQLASNLHFDSKMEGTQQIRNGLVQTKELVLDILNWGQKFAGNSKTEENLAKIIPPLSEEITKLHDPNKSLYFKHRSSEEIILVKVNIELLKSTIRNLMTNAIKACRDGDSITLTLSKSKKEAIIEVKDTGLGMAPDQENQIIDFLQKDNENLTPFYHESTKGNGIGLSIIRRFLLTHQASFSVKSEKDFGTIVTIRLPLVIPIK